MRATTSRLAVPGLAIAVLALAVIAAGCGGSSYSGNSSTSNSASSGGGGGGYGGGGSSSKTSTTPASTGGATAVIAVASNPKLGKILVDSKGDTVYYFEKDKQNGNASTCSGACASVWPPVTTSGAPTGQKGASASKLGTIKRSDGTTEVTYNGWPLYTYAGDKKPGDANGNDFTQFGAQWYALTPAGVKPPES
jgi:predicted lipoprotein with Yx(FWY)xxD motif